MLEPYTGFYSPALLIFDLVSVRLLFYPQNELPLILLPKYPMNHEIWIFIATIDFSGLSYGLRAFNSPWLPGE